MGTRSSVYFKKFTGSERKQMVVKLTQQMDRQAIMNLTGAVFQPPYFTTDITHCAEKHKAANGDLSKVQNVTIDYTTLHSSITCD